MKRIWCWIMPLMAAAAETEVPLEGTKPLEPGEDRSAEMVAGISKWLDRETTRVAAARPLEFKTEEQKEIARRRLRQRLGMVDAVAVGAAVKCVEIGKTEYRAGNGEWTASAVRWPVYDDVWGEGLLLEPTAPSMAFVIAIPDADQIPETVSGIVNGIPRSGQFARMLVEEHCTVLVPVLVSRGREFSGTPRIGKTTQQTHREWLYRQSYEVGRTLIGYEVQKILSALDAFPRKQVAGVYGYGEGGLIALYAGALEPGFRFVGVGGYFGPRERLWEEPIDRNIFGFLREYGDGELAAMILPRALVIDHCAVPKYPKPGAGWNGTAPGKLELPPVSDVRAELERAMKLSGSDGKLAKLIEATGEEPAGRGIVVTELLSAGLIPLRSASAAAEFKAEPEPNANDIRARQERTVRELQKHTQRILEECESVRSGKPLWTQLSKGEAWGKVQHDARRQFWEEVIGKLDTNYVPPNPRTRFLLEREKWRGFEVMLDVHPDLFAWGYLLVPKGMQPGERRPVVVCQHGLEGLPMDTITEDQGTSAWQAYKSFAARLADRGFIVYAPHNPYRGGDKFRELQRKANPLGLSLFSFITAQHDVTTAWLAGLPFVDPARIGFYGLSYGGKTAMRVPEVIDRYCLSICSADFNEWVRKNATTEYAFSYLFTNEYEIFEWDLGHTFNYAEMALLMAPRPFMVERGHDDGVGRSEWVGYEFAKVLRGYAKLGLADRAEIEWFNGPHTIHGEGTFRFLHKWLNWPEPK